MRLDPSFSEFFALLHAHEARYLVVGDYAVGLHGHPRHTADIDVWLLVDTAGMSGGRESWRDGPHLLDGTTRRASAKPAPVVTSTVQLREYRIGHGDGPSQDDG